MTQAHRLLGMAAVAVMTLSGCTRDTRAGTHSASDAARTAAGDSVTQLMQERFAAFSRADWTAWAASLAPDAFLSTADPGRALAGRDSILQVTRTNDQPARAAGISMILDPGRPRLWVDTSLTTAVISFPISYLIKAGDQSWNVPLRSTSVLGRDSGDWQVWAEHYSRPIGYDTLFNSLLRHQVPEPVSLAQDIGPGAGELVAQFRRDLRDFSQAVFAGDAVVVLPDTILSGPQAISAALKTWMGPPGNATLADKGIRAGLTPDARTGWVTTILYVPIFAGPESSVAPIRVLVVYHLAGDHWEILSGHFSVASARPAG